MACYHFLCAVRLSGRTLSLSESEKNRLFFLEVCEFGRSKADWIKVLKYFSKTSDRS